MCAGVIILIWRVFDFGVVVYWGAVAAGAGIGAKVCAGWGTWPPFALGPPFLFNLLSNLLQIVQYLLELLLQWLGALMPEMSFLLAVVTTVVLLFGVISHSDGGCIDLSVESHFYIIPILRGTIIVDVLQDVVLFGLNLHSGLHLHGVNGNVGSIVVIQPAVVSLILVIVIWSPLMRICIVGSVGGLASGWGVCLDILCSSTPVVLSLVLLTLAHGNE